MICFLIKGAGQLYISLTKDGAHSFVASMDMDSAKYFFGEDIKGYYDDPKEVELNDLLEEYYHNSTDWYGEYLDVGKLEDYIKSNGSCFVETSRGDFYPEYFN